MKCICLDGKTQMQEDTQPSHVYYHEERRKKRIKVMGDKRMYKITNQRLTSLLSVGWEIVDWG